MNRILLEPKLDEADPFSQPSGSSAGRGDDQEVAQTFEPKGADRTSPARAPSGSVLLVNPSFTTRARFGKRVRSPTLRPSHQRWDQKTFSAGPRSFSARELWFPSSVAAAEVQPVCDSRHGRIACKASLSCTRINQQGEQPPPISPEGSLSNPFAGWRLLSKFKSSSSLWWLVPETSGSGHSRTFRPSRARPLWPACTPAPWSRSLCWSWPLCGRTNDGNARRSAAHNWPLPRTPKPDICCRTSDCSPLYTCRCSTAAHQPCDSSWQSLRRS